MAHGNREGGSVARVGVDAGGTFTDAVRFEGGLRVQKTPTTPARPLQGVLRAANAVADGGVATAMVHGTTLATNALLTGRMSRTAFLVTRGFHDLLALGRQERPRVFSLEPQPFRPAQPRRRIFEVAERMAADGRVVEKLTAAEVERVAAAVARCRPEAIAICLLHAWRDGTHERRLGRALRKLGVPVVLSSDLAPELREYERGTTTWANAGLAPLVGPLLNRLESELRAQQGELSTLRVMQSDGGTTDAEGASARPVSLALSGPVGGVAAVRSLADARGEGTVVSLDMGGTSTDVALVPSGPPPLGPLQVAGIPLLVRALAVETIGAGGGSRLTLDAGGAITVGPDSAGARPGPACYGRGGREPTLTDAHLLMGNLPDEGLLGGGFTLDAGAARRSLQPLARSLQCKVLDGARAAIAVAEAGMERALRWVTLARGVDPHGLPLYAFGGAGGLHAAALAEALGFARVVVPSAPGAFSAVGLLCAPPRRTLVQTVLGPLPTVRERRAQFARLAAEAVADLRAQGFSRREIDVERLIELRGARQSALIPVREGADPLGRFHAAHRDRFGFAREEEPVLCAALRVTASGRAVSPWQARPRPRSRRPIRQPFVPRVLLDEGAELLGPACIGEYSATTVVPAGWSARAGRFGELVIERRPQ